MARYKSRTAKAKGPYKSKLEARFAKKAFEEGLTVEYETKKFKYIRTSHYIPDWQVSENVFIETKGYLSQSNRSNLLAFREQYPDVTIHLVFQEPKNKINKRSKTTYEQWAKKHGFQSCGIDSSIPRSWFPRSPTGAGK